MDLSNAGWMLRQAVDLQADDLTALAVDFLARAWSLGVTGEFFTIRSSTKSRQWQGPLSHRAPITVPQNNRLDAMLCLSYSPTNQPLRCMLRTLEKSNGEQYAMMPIWRCLLLLQEAYSLAMG